jgi:Rhamnogalacturonate lyase family
MMDNGILQVTFSKPEGRIIGIKYNGIDNLLDYAHKESNLGGYAYLIFIHDSIYNPNLCPVNFNVILLFRAGNQIERPSFLYLLFFYTSDEMMVKDNYKNGERKNRENREV